MNAHDEGIKIQFVNRDYYFYRFILVDSKIKLEI